MVSAIDKIMSDSGIPMSVQWGLLAGMSLQRRVSSMQDARETTDKPLRLLAVQNARVQNRCYVRAIRGIRRTIESQI